MTGEKVAVLTTFRSLPSGYGLVPVVLSQLKMLVNHGYTPVFYGEENFGRHPDRERIPEGVEFRPRVPFVHLFDYQPGRPIQKHDVDGVGEHHPKGNRTNWFKQVDYIAEVLEPELKEFDVVITHDIIFQTWFLVHNAAIRAIAEMHPEIRWIHWLHSGPSPRPGRVKYPHSLRFSDMPNSVWISPNETMCRKFAVMYDIPESRLKVVYHVFDPVRFFDMHPWSVKLIEEHNLYDPDVLAVWATRVDHPTAKGMYKALRLIGGMNEHASATMLFLNSWSNSPSAKANIKALKKAGEKFGIPPERLIFSSEMGKEWERGVPWKVVRDMLMIGNLFVFPSVSETFSFAMIEAAATKNMLILNEKLEVMKELAEHRADYIEGNSEWGGEKITTNYHPDEDAYFREMAIKHLARLGKVSYRCEHCDKPLGDIGTYKPLLQSRHVLKYFNEGWIWENQLKPLIEGTDWLVETIDEERE